MTRFRLRSRTRRRAGGLLVDGFFRSLPHLGRLHPRARPESHGVECIRDVPYRPGGHPAHRLDVYRPLDQQGPLPVLIYVHGGGFRILSKDSHWLMGVRHARHGYVVFNIDYRLAPRHRYPAAIEDACHALAWVIDNARAYGGDPDRLVLAGESAGANLVTSLAVCASYPRPEPFARMVWERDPKLAAVLAVYGYLQVTDPHRLRRRRPLPWWVFDRLLDVSQSYLPPGAPPEACELADPLLVLERGEAPARPLPPFHAPVGTADPLLDDTRRLAAALDALGVPCEARYFPGEVHGFHAFLWRPAARLCWRDMLSFLDRHVPQG